MEDSIFIKVLEHGEDAGLNGTSLPLLRRCIEKEMHIDLKHPDFELYSKSLERLFSQCFEFVDIDGFEENHVLKTEYYFRLIEHRELQESRAAAKAAHRNAFIAIGISVCAIIISAILTWTQVNAPIGLDERTVTSLIESNMAQKNVKLNPQQMEQILSAIETVKPPKKEMNTIQSNEVKFHDLINRYFESQSEASPEQ